MRSIIGENTLRLIPLSFLVIAFVNCTEQKRSPSYELDWVAAEIQQDDDFITDGQSLGILTLRFINHGTENIGIRLSESGNRGLFYLRDTSIYDIYGDIWRDSIQYCKPYDTIFIYISSSTEHPKKVSDEDVTSLLSGHLYYWPDPKFLKPGVLSDSIEIKKAPNFHSATCPSGQPYYRKLFPQKSH